MQKEKFSSIEMSKWKAATPRQIINQIIRKEYVTIAELAKVLNVSVPTITKVINMLVENGVIIGAGKYEYTGGRIPALYKLKPDFGYFLGVEPTHDYINLGITNFDGELINEKRGVPYIYKNTPESLEEMMTIVKGYIHETGIDKHKLLNVCFNVSGRVNPFIGKAYSQFTFLDEPMAKVFSQKIGLPVCIENDTRAMAYGEYLKGNSKSAKNVLFINLSWGLGMGIIIEGNLYYGKSGFSGEIGHMKIYDNNIICHCGKIGCMETEISGSAMVRKMNEKIQNGERSILSERLLIKGKKLTLDDVLNGIRYEDTLCIDTLQNISVELGKNLAGIINVFNPEIVVIGGTLSVTGDDIATLVDMSIKKYSLNIVNEDSKVIISKLRNRAGLIGACMVARARLFEDVTL